MRHSRSFKHGLRVAIATALCGLATAPASADPRLYIVDSARSRVDFRVHYLGLLSAGGRFESVTGSVRFDPDHWDQLAVTIHIAANRLAAKPDFWRQQFLSPGFFDVAHYPTIDFSSERGVQAGPGSGTAYGRLTLHGTTLPVTLVTHVDDQGRAVEFDATATLQRSAFGIVGLLPFVSDEVAVVLHVRGVVAE